MMNSIELMLNHYLPRSLVPRKPLLKNLDNVSVEHRQVTNRFILAIPLDKFLAYFESKLLRDIVFVEQGLIMRI